MKASARNPINKTGARALFASSEDFSAFILMSDNGGKIALSAW